MAIERPVLLRRLVLVVPAAVLATVPVAAGALTPPLPRPLTVTPTTVSDGSTITISGDGCLDPDTQSSGGLVVVVSGERLAYPNIDNPQGLAYVTAQPDASGAWTATIVLDTREEFFGPYDDFDTSITAGCGESPTGPTVVAYEPVAIRYEGARVETTTTSATPTTTSAPPAAEPPVAEPAVAQPARASYTG